MRCGFAIVQESGRPATEAMNFQHLGNIMAPPDTTLERNQTANAYGGNFARLYERLFNGWMRTFAPHLCDYLARWVPHDAQLLDLCCGTGEMSRALLQRGWRIVGLDRSAAMLAVAQEKNAEAITDRRLFLQQGTAEDFSLAQSFDGCLCIDGALNHLESVDALLSCFECVSRVLAPGAPFIFDLLESSHFAEWEGIVVAEGDDYLLVRRGIWDPHRNLAFLKISGGIGGAALWRVRETLISRTFTRDCVAAALDQAGFDSAPCTLTDVRPSGRSIFHAVKRAA